MKKFIVLLISTSLTLAAAAMAAQPDDQNQHSKKKKNQADQTQTTGTPHEAKPAKQHGRAGRATGQKNTGLNANPNTTTNTGASQNAGKWGRGKTLKGKTNTVAPAMTNTSPQATASPAMGGKGKGRHGRNARNETGTPTASASPSVSGKARMQTNTNVSAHPGRGHGKGGKQLDQQVVQKVKSEHANFKARSRPEKIPPVQFNANFRIRGADEWQGPQYSVFRSYHPERHDRGWYHSRYHRIELIGGGYYYFDNGYWFPAWGYDPSEQYYATEAPIYVGHSAEPPDQVIADVQSILKDAGYYEGEVDGLLGPLTRQALVDYQRDNGLYATAVIDEPTLESLGLSS